MILNVSGRTDIVAFYFKWFMNRYQEGFVDVRNPFNSKLVSRIFFDDVDAILFCTKNPLPMIEHLNKIKKTIILQITLTPYKEDIEPNVPSKKLIVDGIKKIAKIIGSENIYIRYDPVFLSEKYNVVYHKKAFDRICTLLDSATNKIIISFIDDYKNVRNNASILKIKPFTKADYQEIGISFAKSAKKHHMTVQTCFEEIDLVEYGFIKADCISKELAFSLTGKKIKKWKARKEQKCNCVEMVDIGAYNSCNHLCRYCYANFDEKKVKKNILTHNPNSSLILGELKEDDMIKIRKN